MPLSPTLLHFPLILHIRSSSIMIPILFCFVSAFIHNSSVGYAFAPSVHRPIVGTKPTHLSVAAGTVANSEAAKVKKSREVCLCLFT